MASSPASTPKTKNQNRSRAQCSNSLCDSTGPPPPAAGVYPRFALSWDVETRSLVSVKKFGAFKYSRHPSTDVWLLAYRSVDGSRLWFPGDRIPDEFIEAAANPAWQAALKIAQAAAPEINAELTEVTGGAVDSINKVAKLTAWLHSQGCTIRSLKKDDVEGGLEEDTISAPARRALQLRSSGAQAAAKKIVAMLDRAGDDDRVRGAFVYHGAATGRWSGEGPQPQNLKRAEEKDIEAARIAVATGDLAYVKTLYSKPLSIIGDLVRSTIVAAPGHVLIGGDFSSIESRVLAHIAGEEWELNSYRRFDATKRPERRALLHRRRQNLRRSARHF